MLTLYGCTAVRYLALASADRRIKALQYIQYVRSSSMTSIVALERARCAAVFNDDDERVKGYEW